jgi:hypothetical protein
VLVVPTVRNTAPAAAPNVTVVTLASDEFKKVPPSAMPVLVDTPGSFTMTQPFVKSRRHIPFHAYRGPVATPRSWSYIDHQCD